MGKIASFIDGVIIGIEREEEHDKLVEVVRRLAENDLYVKLEKFKWKVREVVSRSLTVDFILFFFFHLILFLFSFLSFSIFRTAQVRVDWSCGHISHKLMAKSQD